jgi:RNA repair, ligase-Pnkp-associating, region of Hen1
VHGALLLEVDPIRLVKGRRDDGFALSQCVNDRPHAASGFSARGPQPPDDPRWRFEGIEPRHLTPVRFMDNRHYP